MKIIRTLYHFLGGLYFAIILLSLSIAFVIAGTLLESWTDSHSFAEKYTYGHPFFGLLLRGFFINILFAATRRMPFKKRHIPFLITHCGLLMILGGVMIKNAYGMQGTLAIIEGSSTNRVMFPGSYALHIEDREREELIPLRPEGKIGKPLHFPDLDIALIGATSHCSERLQTFIKGNSLQISGLPPMPLQIMTSDSDPAIKPTAAGQIHLHKNQSTPWDLYAIRTSDPALIIRKIFIDNTRLILTLTATEEPLYAGSLEEALKQPLYLENAIIKLELAFHWSPIDGFDKPTLQMDVTKESVTEKIAVPLCGTDCLRMSNETLNARGAPWITADLVRDPCLAFIEDPMEDVYLFGFDPHGQVFSESFTKENLKGLYSYDKGFAGYAIQTKIPFPSYSTSRSDRETALLAYLTDQLKLSFKESNALAPPLQSFHACCLKENTDFPKSFLSFLHEWHQAGTELYPADRPLPEILARIFQHDTLQSIWPEMVAHRFTEDLLDYNIRLSSIWMSVEENEMQEHLKQFHNIAEEDDFRIETPVKIQRTPLRPPRKMEDRVPLLHLAFNETGMKNRIEVSYDKTGQGWKWPVLFGKYLVRFQPNQTEIPYEVRLRTATQISYPDTQQPYSYECRLIFSDSRSGKEIEKTISMNNVHETWDGYRFYLAGISPADEQAAKRVQIAVNHDPAKYLMTYPGALLLSLGIILLFWINPYKKH